MNGGRPLGRRAFGALAGLGLAAPGLLRAQTPPEMTRHERALYEAARSRNEQVTWYVAHYNSETAEALGRAFDETYPGVQARVVRTTAQVAYQRLTQDMRARVQNCDVFSSTDVGHYVRLKADERLEKYVPERTSEIIESLRGIDPDGFYHTTSIGTVLINYNTDRVKPEEGPQKWTDLLDPKWQNRVTVGHPGFSGYVGTWVVLMRKLYGWDYFRRLERNKPQIGRSINDTVTMLNSGERWVGAGPGATTLRSASRGNPLGVIYPEDGTLLMISPSAIMKGTRNPNAARLFVEFLMGRRASEVQVQNFSEIVRSDVPLFPGARNLAEVKLIRPTTEEIEQGIPEVKELWRETFGV
ncbi:ABC transporter substrate-binding protein [Caldovatus sediminis]|uniref:ABC transporter substrate-binding protein n=1 Tax=Caldovatus sediminis TaxID=2041189 RepID=A0A8J3ECY4_9PROT|nr:extracellular solute-binding protein [Caldovatus sediminis]GGG37421.1 ABC transporter substrate-binding protein [Caldovatus sediminis]